MASGKNSSQGAKNDENEDVPSPRRRGPQKGSHENAAALKLRGGRRVGLDRPCRKCGEAIYFNYKGPVEDLCGRCTDRARRPRQRGFRSLRKGQSTGRRHPLRLGRALLWIALVGGAAAAALMYLG